jgi:hypothetical protein
LQLENGSCSLANRVIGYQLLAFRRNNGGLELDPHKINAVLFSVAVRIARNTSLKIGRNTGSSRVLRTLMTNRPQILKNPVDSGKRPPYMHRRCPDGGIGRRAGFRYLCREAWRFESSSGHQIPFLDRPTWSKNTSRSPVFRAFLLFGVQRRPVASVIFVGTVVGRSADTNVPTNSDTNKWH